MTNTANIRFEPSNVAYVNVDLETHEMTGGVMDETTGTFYPVGGGGGDGAPWVISPTTGTLTEEMPDIIVTDNAVEDLLEYQILSVLIVMPDNSLYCTTVYNIGQDDDFRNQLDGNNQLYVDLYYYNDKWWCDLYEDSSYSTSITDGTFTVSAIGVTKDNWQNGGGDNN